MARRSFPTRALRFVAIGWWATPLVVNVAWLPDATVLLLPVGIKTINLVPTALSLTEPRSLFDRNDIFDRNTWREQYGKVEKTSEIDGSRRCRGRTARSNPGARVPSPGGDLGAVSP